MQVACVVAGAISMLAAWYYSMEALAKNAIPCESLVFAAGAKSMLVVSCMKDPARNAVRFGCVQPTELVSYALQHTVPGSCLSEM